jgi:hypothetical protein
LQRLKKSLSALHTTGPVVGSLLRRRKSYCSGKSSAFFYSLFLVPTTAGTGKFVTFLGFFITLHVSGASVAQSSEQAPFISEIVGSEQ